METYTSNPTCHQVAIRPIENKSVRMKSDSRPSKNLNKALSRTKQSSQMSLVMKPKTEGSLFNDELKKCMETTMKKKKLPLKKNKLNLHEYKSRGEASLNNSTPQVSPEATFPDMSSPGLDKCSITREPKGLLNNGDKINNEPIFFDPIKEAARKILMKAKKQKAEAIRKRDENIAMSKTTKVENLKLQPLISDAEAIKIGITQPKMFTASIMNEKPKLPTDYKETVLSNVGANYSKKSKTRNNCSQYCDAGNELIVNNKSETILNCNYKDFQKDKNINKRKSSVSDKNNYVRLKNKNINELDFVANEVPILKNKKRPFDDEPNKCTEAASNKEEQPQKKKKISLQEYRLRKGVSSNSSSAQSSPEAIFSDTPSPVLDKAVKCRVTKRPSNE